MLQDLRILVFRVIDCFGNVVNYLDWDMFGVIDSNLPILDYETFYKTW